MKAAARVRADAWLSAAEASRLLGVRRATLYAYVSRGFVRSQASSGVSRERTYSRDDVERLRRRTEERRAPDKAAAHALQWGMPILESSIALIDGARLYYRGLDAAVLARSRALEEVAALIWTGGFDTLRAPAPAARLPQPGAGVPFAARAQSMLALAAARDPLAFDLRPASVAATGVRILRLLTQAAIG
ncbi:MAG TPA: citrate synthase, partial [Vicinamibacterales bacterium]|nr:citrate synthase [Vicinamibacterales bacterium]